MPVDPRLELAAEAIAVKIRWFGLVVGMLVANFGPHTGASYPLNVILLLGLGFTALDSFFYLRGRVFLRDYPLVISAMEALFIGLLCLYEAGLDSPFRLYYLLSLICCAVRYNRRITFFTCGLDCLSYGALFAITPPADRQESAFLLTLVILIWVTWAAGELAELLKRAGSELKTLNDELTASKLLLEDRIVERTQQLEESQAQVLHQEKMAAFGLLAAGIAHEVGNPLTSISGIVQMLDRRDLDTYTREKLGIVTGQLARIQAILRELITFSRPASDQRGRVHIRDVVDEALGIAKYYKGGKNREIIIGVDPVLPTLMAVRDQLVQVVFNLVLNAIDATGKGGRIAVTATADERTISLMVSDDGAGIELTVRERLFRPYFTTKKHGTGLGLFVTKRIVDAHGGRISVTSEVGQGTTFTVSLPCGVQKSSPSE